MHINNFVPTIVERSARRDSRICKNGARVLRQYKKQVHRTYRRKMRMQMHDMVSGVIEHEEWDDTAIDSCRCTGWDVA